MKLYDFNPTMLPMKAHAVVGLLITCSAFTENVVNMAISSLLAIDDIRGLTFTTHMNMQMRFSALQSAGNLRFGEDDPMPELRKLVGRLKGAFDSRNVYAHRDWCIDTETGQICTMRRSARTKIEVQAIPVDLDEIGRAGAEMYNLGLELMMFLQHHVLLVDVEAVP